MLIEEETKLKTNKNKKKNFQIEKLINLNVAELHSMKLDKSPKEYGKRFSAFPTTAKPIPVFTEEIGGGFIAFEHVVHV